MMVGCCRIVYGVVVAIFLGNVLNTSYFSGAPPDLLRNEHSTRYQRYHLPWNRG